MREINRGRGQGILLTSALHYGIYLMWKKKCLPSKKYFSQTMVMKELGEQYDHKKSQPALSLTNRLTVFTFLCYCGSLCD